MPAAKTGNFDPKLQTQIDNIIRYMPKETPPSSTKSSGNPGEFAFDSNFIYVCVATNTWKRAALSSW